MDFVLSESVYLGLNNIVTETSELDFMTRLRIDMFEWSISIFRRCDNIIIENV